MPEDTNEYPTAPRGIGPTDLQLIREMLQRARILGKGNQNPHRHLEVTENCQQCGAPSGHYFRCALLNRDMAEETSRRLSEIQTRELNEEDTLRLHSLGVKW